jgi:hypothetical protein
MTERKWSEMDLLEIEDGINAIVQESRWELCIALANIKNRELYREKEIKSFHEYLKSVCLDEEIELKNLLPRINLSISTAYEYATMGDMILLYGPKLDAAGFDKGIDMKKLLVLAKVDRDKRPLVNEAIKKIREMSYQAFLDEYAPRAKKETVEIIVEAEQNKIVYEGATIVSISADWFDLSTPWHRDAPEALMNALLRAVNSYVTKVRAAFVKSPGIEFVDEEEDIDEQSDVA